MAELEERCARLEKENAAKDALIEKLLLRVEQLEAMVFGRKKKHHHHQDDDDLPPPLSGTSPKQPRSAASFRRALPPSDEINQRTHLKIRSCPDCGRALEGKKTALRFVEDIPLGRKIVTEQTIEGGFCPCCRKMRRAIPLSAQRCTLGPNVRLYVLFAVTVLGQTFEKVKAHLDGLHSLKVSDGEIAAIIREGHRKLLPAMADIEKRIQKAPAAHYDETGYPVQQGEQGNYAWVKTSSSGPETIFRLGRTRGKGNAKEMRGPPSDQAGISDDYAAYDALFENHGLCWAHPLRKFRDLAKSGVLAPKTRKRCQSFYEKFCALERSIALAVCAPLSVQERAKATIEFDEKITTLMTSDPLDPSALSTLKKTFLGKREKYLLCIRMPGIPMTNNKAERSLRHLVIKRLLSFGSRSQRGAQAMETLLSVCLTLWWSKPKNYFHELRNLMAV
jgi:hypothetical protein